MLRMECNLDRQTPRKYEVEGWEESASQSGKEPLQLVCCCESNPPLRIEYMCKQRANGNGIDNLWLYLSSGLNGRKKCAGLTRGWRNNRDAWEE